MKSFNMCFLTAATILTVAFSSVASANLLVDPGFEDPITFDGPPFVGTWEGFTGGVTAISQNSSTMPLSGAQHLEVSITDEANAFAGAFQDVTGLSEGQVGIFSGWHKLASGDSGGTEVRIEWRDSAGDVEISRTPNLVPTTTADYTQFVLSDAVPAGADTARLVYAIQSFGGVENQQVFLDDMSFVIPEPSSLLLLSVAGAALLGRRRRVL